jgi:two-component system sensor histidine kinase BarA
MASVAVPFRQSIRFRLSLMIAGVILAAVMSVAVTGAFRDLRQAADARAETLTSAASAYAAALSDPLAMRDRSAAFQHMRGMQNVRSVIFMAIEDPNGKVFAQLGAGASIRGKTLDLTKLEGLDLLSADRGSLSMPIMNGGEEIGALVLLADITDLRNDLYATLGWTLLAAIGAITGGLLVAQVMISRLTQPIRELASVMAEVGSKQDFSRRVEPAKRRDEAGVLGEAFNGMIDNIRERDRRIAHHMETLEQTVEDRTRDYRLAKEEAESANAAKSDFLATMSHEIRTPMNGMMVMAEMLASADLSQRHRRYAEIITRSGASLLTIINDILDLSKIEAGKLDLEAVPFSPERMVEDVASLFWEKARSKGLELAVRIAPEVPLQVVGDPTRLNQVVTNLVNNALKFTETGGVTIDLGAELQGPNARLRIAIRDTGVGIEASRIGAIFEAFSQADQSTTRKFGGTGLGLTVCRRLIDAMGGDIVVTSEVGKGSVFTVVVDLPVEQAAPERPNTAGLNLAIALPPSLLRGCIAVALGEIDATVRTIDAPDRARAGEIVLCLSDQLKRGSVAGAINVLLTDVGDNHADTLIRDAIAADLIPLPLGRQALWDFLARAGRGEFRGPSALATSSVAAPGETFGHLAVLAVDDNAVNREVLREALLSLGVEGDFVNNGREAVEAATLKDYDVIFMDGSMPEMDGFTATRLIREAEGKSGRRRAFIAALTAQVRGADADAWAEAGADRHLTKPFTSVRLMEALKSAGGAAPMIPAAPEAPEVKAVDAGPPAPPLAAVPAPVVEAAPAPAETPMIDEDAVQTMLAVGQRNGRDVLGKVWKLFLVQGPDAAFKLETLAQGTDSAAIAKQAHFLKSMALSAGASRVARLCEEVENAGRAGRLVDAIGRMNGLRGELDAVCAEMQRRLEIHAAANG